GHAAFGRRVLLRLSDTPPRGMRFKGASNPALQTPGLGRRSTGGAEMTWVPECDRRLSLRTDSEVTCMRPKAESTCCAGFGRGRHSKGIGLYPSGGHPCPYLGPWHIHVPLARYPLGTASTEPLDPHSDNEGAGRASCRLCYRRRQVTRRRHRLRHP